METRCNQFNDTIKTNEEADLNFTIKTTSCFKPNLMKYNSCISSPNSKEITT